MRDAGIMEGRHPPVAGSVRRSFAFSALDRYASGSLNLLTMVVLSRLLAPADVGLFMLAGGLAAMIEAFRDFGVGVYLIQEREITRAAVRTSFTVGLALSLAAAAVLGVLAPTIAGFYGDARLTPVLWCAAGGLLLAPISGPIVALLRRDMRFDRVAAINVANAGVNAALSMTLAATGFGHMSMALAALAAAVAGTAVALGCGPGIWMFRPSLSRWRAIFRFGGYSSLTVFLNTIFVSLPSLILGRASGFDAVGAFNRATQLCQLPERLILSALQPVILPALSERARHGGDLKDAYLKGLGMTAAVQWPFLACLALLAEPVVGLLLGPRWNDAALLVRIMAVASMSLFPAFMMFPVLVAIGRIEDTLKASLVSLPPSMAAVAAGALAGPEALAASFLFTGPLQVWVAMRLIRRHLRFAWSEVGEVVVKAAVITMGTVAVPALVMALMDFPASLPLPAMLACVLGAGGGWVAALLATEHPLSAELRGIAVKRLAGASGGDG